MDKVFSKKLRHFKSSDFARGIEFATENPISVHPYSIRSECYRLLLVPLGL